MKRFVSKVQNLSQKAAELKAAVQQVPSKVAEIRETVAATAGQLQQLKSEIHYSVADLKVDQENQLSEALQEIKSSAPVFAKAGFVLRGVDLEISPVQRMLVRLAKVEDVHASVIRSLKSANQQQRTTRAILASLLQAKQMAETVELEYLNYNEVMVGIGPIPSIRLCWRAEEVEEVELAAPQPAALPPGPAVFTPATASQSAFGPDSFFEKRSSQTPVATMPSATSNVATIPASAEETVPEKTLKAEARSFSSAPEISRDPLARFKKMPNLSKSDS